MLDRVFWYNSVRMWLIAGVVVVVGAIALLLIRRFLIARLKRLATRTVNEWDDLALDLFERTGPIFLTAMAAIVAARMLILPERGARALGVAMVLAIAIQIAIWGNGIISFGVSRATRRRELGDGAGATSIAALGFVARGLLWVLIFALALQNLGFQVTALLTGLGIGGIAVALAVQNILGDLFSALSIVIDKPFIVGDTIHIDNYVGTVEHIGVKSTRLRSIYGEELIFSNTDLLKGRIRNYQRMVQRRVDLRFGVVYQTSADDVELIPRQVKRIVEGVEGTRFDRCHFVRFGDSALEFEAVYWILSSEYLAFVDRQQEVNVGLLREFEMRKIAFAYPTRTLHVEAKAITA